MLSRNNSKYVVESVKSVQSQTYTNWELIFLDDASQDNTISQMMEFMRSDKRIKVSRTVVERGIGVNRASCLNEASGRWIAFLDVGDLWEPDKLEKQISFKEENNYGASYSQYQMLDESGSPIGGVVGGPEVIDSEMMRKCCWAEYLTVMYDVEKVKEMSHLYTLENSDYALLMNICDRADCHLLKECLATSRQKRKTLKNHPLKRRISWRYDTYRIALHKNQIVSLVLTIRNFYYTMVRRYKYIG